jgi:hypothetical protein
MSEGQWASDRDRFYAARDLRTTEYIGGDTAWVERPVGLAIGGPASETRAGQMAFLAQVNMAVRLHRRLVLVVPQVSLAARSLVPARDLREAAEATALAINPFIELSFVVPSRLRDLPSVAIGRVSGASPTLWIGADGCLATLAPETQPFDGSDESLFGAAFGSCLSAAALTSLSTGNRPPVVHASLFGFADGAMAAPGGFDLALPIDVGDVLVVGGGAVASAFLYWIREFGKLGRWIVVDGDRLLLHNTNRSLGTLADQTDWAGDPQDKAVVAGHLVNAEASVAWYDEWLGSEAGWKPNLVLPLANDRAVRRAIAMSGERLLIHATTGRDWTAELHRHIEDVDECIACRFPEPNRAPTFACSSGQVTDIETGRQNDAALPFLSAASGLMLARALAMHASGELTRLDANFIQLWLGQHGRGLGRFTRRRAPARDSCTHLLPFDARRLLRR